MHKVFLTPHSPNVNRNVSSRSGSRTTLHPVLQKLQKLMQQRKVRAKEFFRDFDHLRSGRITMPQFERCLAAMGIHPFLTDEELAALQNEYGDTGKSLSPAADHTNPSDTKRTHHVPLRFIHYVNLLEDLSRLEDVAPLSNRSQFHSSIENTTTTGHPPEPPTTLHDTRFDDSLAMQPPTNCTSDEDDVLQKIWSTCAHEVKTRGLNLKECFNGYDKTGRGQVSWAQFRRGCPFALSEMQFGILQRKYQPRVDDTDAVRSSMHHISPSGTQMTRFHYLSFCRDVETHLTNTLGVDTTQNVSGSGDLFLTTKSLSKSCPPRTMIDPEREETCVSGMQREDGQALSCLLNELCHRFEVEGIRYQDPFLDFDPRRTGFITPHQFQCALGELKLAKRMLTQEELDCLTCYYSNCEAEAYKQPQWARHRRVNYRAFLRDVAAATSHALSHHGPARRDPLSKKGKGCTREECDVEDILQRIRAHIRTRRLDMKPFLQDFDRSMRGVYQTRTCTANHFERALTLMGVSMLQGDDMVRLLNYYAVSPSQCGAYGHKTAKTVPLHELNALRGSPSLQIRYHDFCEDLEHDVFDPSLQSLESQSPLKSSNDLNVASRRKGGSLRCTAHGGTSPRRGTVQEVLRMLHEHTSRYPVRLQEFLRDFDPLRLGSVSQSQLCSGLSILGISLTETDVALLAQEFPSRRSHPPHGNGPTDVAYMELVRAIERMKRPAPNNMSLSFCEDSTRMTQDSKMESQPLSHSMQTRATSGHPQPKEDDLPPFFFTTPNDEQAEGSYLIERIRDAVRQRGLFLESFFQDVDRHHTGKVSGAQFHQVLSRCGLPLTPPQVVRLARLFQCPSDPNFVSVTPFVRAVTLNNTYRSSSSGGGMTTGSHQAESVPVCGAQQSMSASSMHVAIPATMLKATPSVEKTTVHALLDRICTFVHEHRVRVQEFFEPFDRIRHGVIPVERFPSILDAMGIKLRQEEYRLLTEYYQRTASSARSENPTGAVIEYTRFCRDVEPLYPSLCHAHTVEKLHHSSHTHMPALRFTQKDLPRILKRVASNGSRIGPDTRVVLDTGRLEPTARQQLQRAVEQIRSHVARRHLLLKVFFEDYDRHVQRKRVSRTQFHSALHAMKLTDVLTPSELRTVLDAFQDEDGNVHYGAFIQMVQE